MQKEGYQPRLPNFEETLEQDAFYEFLPFSDLNRWVQNGIYTDAFNAFPLGRLGGVKALSLLSYVGPKPEDRYFVEYGHTRLDHSLVVALTIEQILKLNGFAQEEINLGIIAGLLHDIATPAHGDATKKIDPKNLDEEEFWWEVLDRKGYEFIFQHGGNKDSIGKIIKNEGVLGEVLDIADRITYTMKDVYATLEHETTNLNIDPYLLQPRYIISRFPKIGNIYQDVGVDNKNQEVFFNDPQKLEAFLLLRANMHKTLYLHPTGQGRDLFFTKLLEPLYANGNSALLNPTVLRRMSDHELMLFLCDHYFPSSNSELYSQYLVNWYPEYERFDSEYEALKRKQEISQTDNIAVIGITNCRRFNPATSYKVVNEHGKIEEFREVKPVGAKNIEAIAKSTEGVFLFYADVSGNSPINNLIKTIHMKNR